MLAAAATITSVEITSRPSSSMAARWRMSSGSCWNQVSNIEPRKLNASASQPRISAVEPRISVENIAQATPTTRPATMEPVSRGRAPRGPSMRRQPLILVSAIRCSR